MRDKNIFDDMKEAIEEEETHQDKIYMIGEMRDLIDDLEGDLLDER